MLFLGKTPNIKTGRLIDEGYRLGSGLYGNNNGGVVIHTRSSQRESLWLTRQSSQTIPFTLWMVALPKCGIDASHWIATSPKKLPCNDE